MSLVGIVPPVVVSAASLVDWIWGEHPPADATNTLQRLVSRLRKALPDGVVEGVRLTATEERVDARSPWGAVRRWSRS
jgi:DNA-binding SARP family transcriptional activator